MRPREEHTHLRVVERAAKRAHYCLGYAPAAAVGFDVGQPVPLIIIAVSLGGGKLETAECSAVYVALHL